MQKKSSGKQKPQLKKIRCKVCHRWFTPPRSNSKTCSKECSQEYANQLSIDRYHNMHPKAAYGRRVEGKQKPKSFLEEKVDRRSARSRIRDILRSTEQSGTITKEEKKAVEAIMALPVELRWNAGAKNWTPEQRKHAQKIEIKRISSEFSSINSSFDQRDYGSPSFGEDKKKRKEELPYKFDVFDESDESSSIAEDSGDSTADSDEAVQDITETSAYQLEDEELDATDEENQA